MEPFANAPISGVIDNAGTRLLTVCSPALRGRADISMCVPPEHAGDRLPLLILLHGVYGSHWNWWALGGLAENLRKLKAEGHDIPFAIAMPSDGLWGSGSAYVPHRTFNAESWIIEDVPDAVAAVFPNVDTSRLYLAGQSMGGYGALRLGMKYADRICGISAHSAVTRIEQLQEFVPEAMSEFLCSGAENVDLLYWAQQHRAHIPSLRFDCGREDSLLEGNRSLDAALHKAGIPHVYEELEGGHTWEYWRTHLLRTLRIVSELERQRST